ncbi:MAG: hypothetical protein QY328_13455 [Anaerolineales bacterium]|nr:hypothetical protein [Anaerolineales bacterium]WKZ39266.1 MAG: hypothetical protein QY328_13455 [Anaerolineales bacterium]
MNSLHEHLNEYRKLLKKGAIQKAYKGLMEYMMGLRTYFDSKYPHHFVSGSIYYGYMDMTYFSVIPVSLKQRKLKAAIVFVHETFRFEIWLAGYNKQVQSNYWKLFKESSWDKYPIVPTIEGVDSIVECVLVEEPDFSNLDALTKQIEKGALKFIKDIESFLSKHAS